MKRVLATSAAALAIAAVPAGAKEVTAATVCGDSGCRDLEDRALLYRLFEGGAPTDPPDDPSGWFRTTVTVAGEGGARDRFSFAALPRERLIRGEDGTWMPMSKRTAQAFRRVTRGLEPMPAATLQGPAPEAPAEAPAPEPAPGPERAAAGDGSMPAWQAVALGALLAAVVVAMFPRTRRRLASLRRSTRP